MFRFVDQTLARRLEAAHTARRVEYVCAQARLHPDWGAVVEPIADGMAVFGGATSVVRGAGGLGMCGPVTQADMVAVERFFRSRGAPPRVDACPLADPSLLERLREGRYSIEEYHSVLVRVPGDGIAVPPHGVEVRQIRADERDLWLRVVAAGFEDRDAPTLEVLDIIAPSLHSASALTFMAWIDGRPAGGGSLFPSEGVAELGSDSTLPAFRGRGVQSALVDARVRAARELGCALVIALAEPGERSQRNMERAGFQLAYTKAIMIGPDE